VKDGRTDGGKRYIYIYIYYVVLIMHEKVAENSNDP
jgi:hypothetical protein